MRYADAHCDISANILYAYPEKIKFFKSFRPEKEGWLPHQIDLKKILESQAKLMVWSVCPVELNDGGKIKISDQWTEFIKHIDVYEHLFREYSDFFSLVTSAKELEYITQETKKIAVILHLEGIDCITQSGQLQEVYDLGVRSFGLCGITSNQYAISGTEDPNNTQGLSQRGTELVKKITDLPVALDFAHLNQSSFSDLAQICTQPIYVSHTACHSIHPDGQNMTNEQMQEVKKTKGVMGLPLFPFLLTGSSASVADYNQHVQEAFRIIGQNGVCIGSDFDGMFNPVLQGGECISDIPKVIEQMDLTIAEKENFGFNNLYNYFKVVLA